MHTYMEVWILVQDEMLILKHEPTNIADRNAVAVYRRPSGWAYSFQPYPAKIVGPSGIAI